MKTNSRTLLASLTLALTLASNGLAQTTVSTTTNGGTISEFTPDTIVIRSEASPQPLRYSYTKTTTYVDETGAPVSMETVKSGLPVTVYYVKEGDRLVASRVVVKKTATVTAPAVNSPVSVAVPAAAVEEKTSTTTTTTTK